MLYTKNAWYIFLCKCFEHNVGKIDPKCVTSLVYISKAYWLIIFFFFLTYTIKLLNDNIQQYLQFQVITSTSLAYSSGFHTSITLGFHANIYRTTNFIFVLIPSLIIPIYQNYLFCLKLCEKAVTHITHLQQIHQRQWIMSNSSSIRCDWGIFYWFIVEK